MLEKLTDFCKFFLINFCLNFTAKDLKKDKPKKKKEEIVKKGKSKEELENETLKDSEVNI